MIECANCHTPLTPGVKYPAIDWDNAPKDWFCGKDCVLDYMARQNIRWVNPNPQPDVE